MRVHGAETIICFLLLRFFFFCACVCEGGECGLLRLSFLS